MLWVWTFCIATGIVCSCWYGRITDARKKQLEEKVKSAMHYMNDAVKIYWVIGAFFVLRFVHTLGILQTLEVAAFIALLHYIKRANTRSRKSDEFWLRQALKNPEAAAAFLGPNIPQWISFPAVERTAWLDQFVANMWKEMSVATEGTVISWIDWYCDYYRPNFLSKLETSVCKMGSVPFKFNGVEIHKQQTETILDFHISWVGDPDIRIVAAMGPVEVETIITDFQLQAVLRVGFGPHIPEWPCFAAMTMAFVNKPFIDFKLKAAKLNLDVIPGLSDWLDTFIRDILAWCMVHPKRIIIPMVADFDKNRYGYTVDPIGTVTITILSCENLKKALMMNPNAYAKVHLIGSDKRPRKTEVISSENPTFDESFRFTIYDPSSQILIQVLDKTRLKAVKLATDRLIGEVQVYMTPLMDGEYHQLKAGLSNKEEPGQDLGSINYGAQFVRFKSGNDDDEEGEEAEAPEPPQHGPPLSSARSVDAGSSPSASPRLPKGRPEPKQKKAIDSSGVLFINVVQCNGLKNVEGFGKSDPYVLLRVGKNVSKSPVVKNDLDPVFGFETQLDVGSTKTEALTVEVYDWEKIGKDRLIGSMELLIGDIMRSGRKMQQSWPLNPQGTITMELKMLVQ